MQFLSKYGVARHIYLPIIKREQVDFAVSGDWTPAAGDVKISKDGGAAANVTNLPTAITMGNGGIWDFSLTATELEAAQIVVTVVDASTKAVEDQAFIIETYGHGSGQHALDLDAGWPSNFSSLSIDSNGRTKALVGMTKNVAFANFVFFLTDSTAHQPLTGKLNADFTKQYSLDGGAFASITGSVTEIGNGFYKVDLLAAELNADTVALRLLTADSDVTALTIITSD